jgi:hypothetical protein
VSWRALVVGRWQGGHPFWSAKKRPPTPVDFSMDDPLHMDYIVAASNLLARLYRIPECDVRRVCGTPVSLKSCD